MSGQALLSPWLSACQTRGTAHKKASVAAGNSYPDNTEMGIIRASNTTGSAPGTV